MGHQLTAFVFTCSEHMVNGFRNPNAPNFATLEVDSFYWYLIIHMCSDPQISKYYCSLLRITNIPHFNNKSISKAWLLVYSGTFMITEKEQTFTHLFVVLIPGAQEYSQRSPVNLGTCIKHDSYKTSLPNIGYIHWLLPKRRWGALVEEDFLEKWQIMSGLVAYICNFRTWEKETGIVGLQNQTQPHSEYEASLGYLRPRLNLNLNLNLNK